MTFKKMIGCAVAIGCIATAASAVMAQEEAASLSNSFSVAYASKYVWRGLVLNPDPVVQPSLTLTLPSGLSYNYWTSYNTETNYAGPSHRAVEIDHTISYPVKLGQFAGSLGYVYYSFPGTSTHATSEFFTSFEFGGKFNPTVYINYDVDQVKGAYYALGGSYSCAVPFVKTAKQLDLSMKIGVGDARHNEKNYGVGCGCALADLTVGASTTFELGKNLSLVPSVTYSRFLDADIRDSVADPDNLIIGASLDSSF